MICFKDSSILLFLLYHGVFLNDVIKKIVRVSNRINEDRKRVYFLTNIRLENVQGKEIGLEFDNG